MSAASAGFVPHLAIIQVGEREDSSVYVRMKELAAAKVPLRDMRALRFLVAFQCSNLTPGLIM
ncbi:hypothetical protein BDZ88DRAFT_425053 [Geranomyces variabilis]|nr:hypothetical protein BDZ88DRAFT_425053 [Geranomyces variabilis]